MIFSIIYSNTQQNQIEIKFSNSNKIIVARYADTVSERAQGLMYVTALAENQGMLFVYDTPRIGSFWMKNTYIPLEIYFIDENNEIIDIQYMKPCEKEPCPYYVSPEKIKYALEVNQGIAEKYNITIGDKIEFISK